MADDVKILNSIRTIGNTVTFKVFNYEHNVSSPSQNRDLLTDIYLSLHGHPTYLETGRRAGIGLEDLRVYLDSYDITNSVIACLRNNLDAVDQVQLKSQYEHALNNWLLLEEKLEAAYPGKGINKDRAIAKHLLETKPLSANLAKLGDQTAGWGGNLHIFNFIYCQLNIPLISLKSVVEHFNAANSEPIDFSSLGKANFTFSIGPCRLFTPKWNPTQPFPQGTLTYGFEFNYHDPILDRVTSLENRVLSLEDRATVLENRVTSLEDKFNDVDNRLISLSERVDDIDSRVNSLDDEFSSLQEDFTEQLDLLVEKVSETEPESLQRQHLIPIQNTLNRANDDLNKCLKDLTSHELQIKHLKTSVEQVKRSVDSLS